MSRDDWGPPHLVYPSKSTPACFEATAVIDYSSVCTPNPPLQSGMAHSQAAIQGVVFSAENSTFGDVGLSHSTLR